MSKLSRWGLGIRLKSSFSTLIKHVTGGIEFWDVNAYAFPGQALYNLPDGTLSFLNHFLLAADAQPHRLESSTGYYA
mgnify:CR=1 FL=1